MPDHIVNRSKKGFGIPIAKWINGPFKKDIKDVLMSKKIISSKWLNTSYIEKLLNEHFDKKKDNRKLIWTLFVLENWLLTHPH